MFLSSVQLSPPPGPSRPAALHDCSQPASWYCALSAGQVGAAVAPLGDVVGDAVIVLSGTTIGTLA